MTRRLAVLSAAVVAALTLAAACGGDGDDAAQGPPSDTSDADTGETTATGDGAGLSGDLTVFAAASLNVVFEDVADLFTERHPETSVTFSFAGSSDLVAQLDAGAPVDVLATANEATMASAVEAGNIAGAPQIFADNVLTLVVPEGNPGDVTGLDESLEDADLVVCAPQVPCGAATLTLTDLLGIAISPVSEEGSVTDVLGKVTSGQADAGLVYTTDATAAGDAVEIIPVQGADEVVNNYPIAVTADTGQPELAAAWLDFVLGPEAQQVLGSAGFGTP